MLKFQTIPILVVLAGSLGCDAGPFAPRSDAATINDGVAATVRFTPIEGGCWAIVTTGGTVYEPVGLPAAFRKHGLEVVVNLRDRDDLASFCMIGQIADVVSIRAR